MSKSENRHFTKKWKKKRKNHSGDKCNLPKCGLCSPHKRIGNSKKLANRKEKLEIINNNEFKSEI
jgi:hypothetical protein